MTTDLQQAVEELSDEAFRLARETATAGADDAGRAEREARATELRGVLPRLGERLRALPEDEVRSRMSHLLSESNLDLRYVVAGGNLPSSIRLHVYVEGLRA
jgi:hypothetical protein